MSGSRFSDQFLDELRARVPVSDVVRANGVALKKEGVEMVALSPFVNEKTPSFKVNDTKQLWKCFSSGKGGDHIKFLVESGFSFVDAVKRVAEIGGVPMPGESSPKQAAAKPAQPKQPPVDHNELPPHESHPNAPGNPDPAPSAPTNRKQITATYDYLDRDEALIYQVVRFEWMVEGKRKKSFGQRQPAPGEPGIWIWGLSAGEFMRKDPGKDWRRYDAEQYEEWKLTERKTFDCEVAHGLYRLPQLWEELSALKAGEDRPVFLPEGEKDVQTFVDLGLVASCNSGGAKNWKGHHAEYFRGLDVIVPIDADEAGRLRGEKVCGSLKGVARRVRLFDVSQFWAACPKGGDVTDWIKSGVSREQLMGAVDTLKDWQPAPFESAFGAIRWEHQNELSAAPYAWLVKGLVPLAEITLVIGESQSGKSFMVSDLALHVATGGLFPGSGDGKWYGWKIPKAMGVVYCAAEKGKGHRIRMRANRMNKKLGLDGVPLAVTTREFDLFADGEKETDKLIAEIKGLSAPWEVELGLVVIDTHDAATGEASEVDKKELMLIKKRYRRIVAETGAALIVIQHKNAAGNLRGNQVLYNGIDTCLDVVVVKEGTTKEKVVQKDKAGRPLRRCTVLKQSEGVAGGHWDYVLRQVEVGRDPDGDAVTTCIVEAPDDVGASQRRWEPGQRKIIPKGFVELPPKARRAFVALKEVLAEHGQEAPVGVRCPPDTVVVSVTKWREELMRQRAGEEGTLKDLESAVKKTIQRAIENWTGGDKGGLVDKDHEWIWRTSLRVVGVDPEPLQSGPAPSPVARTQQAPGNDEQELF